MWTGPDWRLLGFVWGLFEASIFYLVPDILLTLLALRRPHLALRTVPWCLAGALAGGAGMFWWGGADTAGAEGWLVLVPGITKGLVSEVAAGLAPAPFWAMLKGAFSGVPFKIFAVELGAAGQMSLFTFLPLAALARLPRFLVAVAATHYVVRPALERFQPGLRPWLLVAAWTVFYILYLGHMGDWFG